MKISIIIPVYNEETTINTLFDSLNKVKEHAEIIFVDGGSTDGTQDMIADRYPLVRTVKGKGLQMNAGAGESTGDVLFFLHCDSELPDHPLESIEKVMKSHRVGCFGIAFRGGNLLMKCCQFISNHRIKDRKIMFGDQGIFVDRSLFFDMGGFPEIPVMEDYQFSLNLRERGIKIGVADKRIYTSDRRFREGGLLRVMWKMNRLRAMYRRGVSVNDIAEMYQDVRSSRGEKPSLRHGSDRHRGKSKIYGILFFILLC